MRGFPPHDARYNFLPNFAKSVGLLPPNPAIPRRLLINPVPDSEIFGGFLGTNGPFPARFGRALIAASWVVLSLSCPCSCSCAVTRLMRRVLGEQTRETCVSVGMGCFGCFLPEANEGSDDLKPSKPNYHSSDDSSGADARRKVAPLTPDVGNGYAHSFTFKDLLVATGYFSDANFIGEGGFGKVYKGKINGQIVAVKQLSPHGVQGRNEFLVEVLMLTVLNHPNLVSLVGFCAQGDERLLVYEYMPLGSLESHLFDVPLGKQPLDWNTRVRIAVGVAEGLSYLHNVADPPIIYRDMKAANILLDDDFSPKLSDFGLAKVGPVGDRTHVSTRVMGTYGYCAPDYVVSGKLTMKSDIYSFGVLLLELITGRRIYDASRPKPEQSLLTWSRPFLHDKRKFHRLADPALQGCYPTLALNQLVVISIMCLQDQPHVRPIVADVAIGLSHVASQPYVPERPPASLSSPAKCGSPQYVGTPSRRRGGRRFVQYA